MSHVYVLGLKAIAFAFRVDKLILYIELGNLMSTVSAFTPERLISSCCSLGNLLR